MSQPARPGAITTAEEAARVIANLHSIMDTLQATVEEETRRLRDGDLRQATELEPVKSELAGRYAVEAERLKTHRALVKQTVPDQLETLRQRHDSFQQVLRKNLTVLATAHAVSEGIVRGVSGELARRAAPSTYGATGKANAPRPQTAPPPMSVSRSL